MNSKNNYIKDIVLFFGSIIIVLSWIFYFSYFKSFDNFKAFAIEKFYGINSSSVQKTIVIENKTDVARSKADTQQEQSSSKVSSSVIVQQDKTDNDFLNSAATKQELKDGEKVNINTATEQDLMLINGIGEVLAARIITYRNENGLFKDLKDIKNVKGIGDKTYEKIYPFISLNK